MKEKEWPAVCRLIQSILKHTKRPSLGNKGPITAFTCMLPDSLLLFILPLGQAQPRSLEFINAQRLLHSAMLLKAVYEIHKEVVHNRT